MDDGDSWQEMKRTSWKCKWIYVLKMTGEKNRPKTTRNDETAFTFWYILLDAKVGIKYKIHWCHWWDNWNAEKVENIRPIRMPNGIKSIDIVFQTGKGMKQQTSRHNFTDVERMVVNYKK